MPPRRRRATPRAISTPVLLATAGALAGFAGATITSAAVAHNVAVGDAILVSSYDSTSYGISSITDTAVGPQGQVNTYVKLGSGGTQNTELWYCINAWAGLTSGVDTITVVYTNNSSAAHFHAIGVTGIMAPDLWSVGSGTGPSFTRSTGVLSQAAELVVGVCCVANAGAGITWTAPLTSIANLHVGANIYSNTAYDIVSATTSVTCAGTVTGASALTEGVGTFKGGTTGVGPAALAAKKIGLSGTGTYTAPPTLLLPQQLHVRFPEAGPRYRQHQTVYAR
jgi:hypothetical protein